MKRLCLALVLLLSFNAFSQAKDPKDPRREKLIGNILKNALETYHYRGTKITDEVSQKAFQQYLKKSGWIKAVFNQS